MTDTQTKTPNLYALVAASAEAKHELTVVSSMNDATARYGLVLSDKDIHALVECRQESLKEAHRVEFGASILPILIREFCDSPYINQTDYKDTLSALQDIFYACKNECMDKDHKADLISDEDLIRYMKHEFDGYCGGDINELGSTCLERLSYALRAGLDYNEAVQDAESKKLSFEDLSRYIGADDEVMPDYDEDETEMSGMLYDEESGERYEKKGSYTQF